MSKDSKHKFIAVVDDHPVVIEGLQKILESRYHAYEINAFVSGEIFLAHLKQHKDDVQVVLLDITLPGKSGIELCREIKIISPITKILAFSNHSERSIIMQMIYNGASGYLLKNASVSEVIDCIEEALNGQITFSKEVKEIISHPSARELKPVSRLTKREKEILRMIADGKTSIEIGNELFVSSLTIETHRRNLMQKFNVKNVAELIKLAAELKLL